MNKFKRVFNKLWRLKSSLGRRWAEYRSTGRISTFFVSQYQYNLRLKERQVGKMRRNLHYYLYSITEQNKYKKFVFMFSGTIYIQEKRANRPIRLTRVFIGKNIPVFFSYFRWDLSETIAENYDSRLFQSPIDITFELMREIIRFDFGKMDKIFILSFPHPYAARFINEFNAWGWKTLYDVRDDWEEFHKVGMAKWYDKPAEIYAVTNCDVVTTVSQPLQQKMQAFTRNKTVQLCPNAYDIKFMDPTEVANRKAERHKIIIGYFGHLTDRWFDWEFLRKVADAKPEWQFQLIGHPEPTEEQLRPNIIYKGFLGHDEICHIARSWCCGIIPFKMSKLADGIDPIKIYEYLALGLPTVSLVMPQIRDYPYVTLADSVGKFIEGIEKSSVIETDPEYIRKWLAENTWEKRVKQMLDLLASNQTGSAVLKKLALSGGEI